MRIEEIQGMPDYAKIMHLINAEWPVEFGEVDDASKLHEMIESHDVNNDTIKFLYDDDNIVGYYRYTLWPRDKKNTTTAHTFDITIDPTNQMHGLGSMLMHDMFDDCREKGLELLLSRSFKSNEASIRLHKSLGFSLHLETDDSYVWEKSLVL